MNLIFNLPYVNHCIINGKANATEHVCNAYLVDLFFGAIRSFCNVFDANDENWNSYFQKFSETFCIFLHDFSIFTPEFCASKREIDCRNEAYADSMNSLNL